jgi:DNA-binding NtrC family response regulator
MERAARGAYNLLIVDDEEGIRHGLKNFFTRQGYRVYEAADFHTALELTRTQEMDVVVIDIRLKSGKNGIDLLRELRKTDPDLVEIIITGYGSIDTAVTSMKEGAADYIVKPIDNKKLLNSVVRNLELRELKNENIFLKRELMDRCLPNQFITQNPDMRRLLEEVDRIKNSPVTILIQGESGTGKEVLARYIHFTSTRKEGRFVTINCAALSEHLLLSELFGHEKGAFTGAIERQIGKFEIADRGTLFLDEISEMSRDIQAKLLRVIEENSFERVGSTRRIYVDVRIIVATNTDLEGLIARGMFREDLYYRINVMNLFLTPLRMRKEDIPLLVEHFLDKYNRLYNKEIGGFSPQALEILHGYHWPGNARELENVVNQVVLLNDGGIIEAGDLKKSHFAGQNRNTPPIDVSEVTSLKDTMSEVTARYEKHIISHFLQKNRYNQSKTASELSLTRKTLAEKIRRYNLKPD